MTSPHLRRHAAADLWTIGWPKLRSRAQPQHWPRGRPSLEEQGDSTTRFWSHDMCVSTVWNYAPARIAAVTALTARGVLFHQRYGNVIQQRCGGICTATLNSAAHPVQPNRASSKDERLPDRRATVAATVLQSLARESLLASLARRQASACASRPKSEMSASVSEEIASRNSWGRW
jgi:hypothetical protein